MSGPAYHARTHLPGGTDPLELVLTSGVSPGPFGDYVLSFSSLLGYWRLGESASPFADTSGRFPAAPSDAAQVTRGNALATDQTGAVTDDDGAILFTANGTPGDYLDVVPGTGGADFDFPGSSDAFTVAAWVKVEADAGTFTGAVVSNMFSTPPTGWALFVEWPARTVTWYRQQTGGTAYSCTSASLVVDQWYLLVGTYDGAGEMALYVDGALVDTQATAAGLPNWNNGPQFGGGAPNGSTNYFFHGTIDEIAIWDDILTPDEVAGLWARGASEENASSGEVLTADGAGGTAYAFPTLEIDGGRYSSIALGSHLSGTDNLDGSITLEPEGLVEDTLVDAKGDLLTATAADTPSRLPVGTDGQVLIADSSAATGLAWGAATAGASATDAYAWMPLTTVVGGDPELVWDASDELIPTLTPL